MDESDYPGEEPSYRMFRQRMPGYGLTLPLVVLLIVVAVVSGLVFSGVIQGDESRVGPVEIPTTQSTMQIVP